jgi:parvulin-like peptidyl-prolyl isomerase
VQKKLSLVLLVPVLLLAAACGSTKQPAASAAGTDISDDALRHEIDGAAEFAADNPGVLDGFAPDAEGNTDMVAVRVLLFQLIQEAVLSDELERLGGEVTEAERADTLVQISDFNTNQWAEDFVERQALVTAFVREASASRGLPETAVEWLPTNGDDFVCASHLLVETPEEAEDARSRIVDDGEDFAAVAAEVSIDTTSGAQGGNLGCAPASNYVDPFAEATLSQPVGEVGEPVQSDFGYHVIVVTARGDEIAEGSEAVIEQAYQTAIVPRQQALVTEVLGTADISVDPRYGVWDPATAQIVDG